MKLRYFGDSYDIVKKSLLQWLAAFGPWSAHPMFTEPVQPSGAEAFSRFLGVPLVSVDVLQPDCDRRSYFDPCRSCRSLFLDPDTGVRLQLKHSRRAPEYIFASEVVNLVHARPGSLTLIFDKSLARGREHQQVREKLGHLAAQGVHGFAYVSHASFIVLGEVDTIRRAHQGVLSTSGLPGHRIVGLDGA